MIMDHLPSPPVRAFKPKSAQRIADRSDSDVELEPLIDTTEAIPLRSKKISRLQKKQDKKAKKEAAKPHLHTLPAELLLQILSYLRPNDVFQYAATNRHALNFYTTNKSSLTKNIITLRYATLTRCFPRPHPLSVVDPVTQSALLDPDRQDKLIIHRRYAHIQPFDENEMCSCLACIMAWNQLNLIVDFGYFVRAYLAHRKPIPMFKRGAQPEWNIALTARHAALVRKAMQCSMWYARILQYHLSSMVREIVRYSSQTIHAKSKIKQKYDPPFQFSASDVASEMDTWCARKGPSNYEFPYMRDHYYTLPTYLPGRVWRKDQQRWGYIPADQHRIDCEWTRARFQKTPVDVNVKAEADRGREAQQHLAAGLEGHGPEDEQEQEVDSAVIDSRPIASMAEATGASPSRDRSNSNEARGDLPPVIDTSTEQQSAAEVTVHTKPSDTSPLQSTSTWSFAQLEDEHLAHSGTNDSGLKSLPHPPEASRAVAPANSLFGGS